MFIEMLLYMKAQAIFIAYIKAFISLVFAISEWYAIMYVQTRAVIASIAVATDAIMNIAGCKMRKPDSKPLL